MVNRFEPHSVTRVMRAMAIALVAVALIAVPVLAGDGGETRSTVEYGPDLAVSAGDITLSKAVLMAGVEFNVTVKVYNLGDEDASDVSVDLLVDTEQVDRFVIELVPVDGWRTASFDLSLTQGDHTIGILVDADDAIDERREDNNDASLSVRVRSLPDASVSASGLSVSSTHPMEGEVLTIEATVRNLGESAATLVVVQFWDGVPGLGTLISNQTTSVPEGGQKLVTSLWDTTGLGGTHTINVYISKVLPGEDKLNNNLASITVLIFTHWDLVIDATTGDKSIDQEYKQDGFVTVREGATLTLTGTSFELHQDYENQFALFVESGGSLVLDNTVAWSEWPFLVILDDGTSLHMSSTSQLWATVILQGYVEVSIEDSLLDGGIVGSAGLLSIMGSEVTGELSIDGGGLMVESSLLSSVDTTVLTGTKAVIVDTVFSGGSETSLQLTAGATCELRNVTCEGVATDEWSTAMVFRRVEVVVEDESTLTIPSAEIEVRHYINGTVVGTSTGGEDGRAVIEVMSDIINDGESHFIGNYIIWATFGGREGAEPLLLTPFPTMDWEANLPQASVVLPPVEPRDLISSTAGDMVIQAGQEMALSADYIQDGNILVRGRLSVATSTLKVLQDRDHQYYVIVEAGGTLVLQGATLTSNYPINVYLYGNSSLVMSPGSTVDVTTLVSEGGATISAQASTFSARMLLRGGQVTMANSCVVEGDMVVIEVPILDMKGGEIYVEELHVDSPAASLEGITMTAQSVHFSGAFANVTGSSIKVVSFHADSNILTLNDCAVEADEPLDMAVATLYMDTTSSNQPLVSSREDTKVYLTDAEVPYPFSLGNATVLVYWYLTVVIQDVLANPVSDVDVEIFYTSNGTSEATGVTNDDGKVRLPLLGSIVTPEGEYFVGNYKIVAKSEKAGDEEVVRFVNLDRAKTMTGSFSKPIVPPTQIAVEIFIANTTVVAGTEFVVNGVATAVFPTVRSPLFFGEVEVQLWDNVSTWSNTTVLDQDGAFEFTVPAPFTDGVYHLKVVVTPTGEYAGVANGISRTVSIDVIPPGPTTLVVVLETTKISEFPAGGMLVVRGTVKYNTAQGAPAPNVRVFLDDPISMQKYQTQADGLGVFEFTPRVGPRFFGQYDYFVTARDDDLDMETSDPAKLTIIAVEVEEQEESGPNWLLWTVIIVIIAVAAIGGTLGYWAFSSKGRMVECGECGTLVRDTATQCPKCGIEFEVEVAKCSECESWIRSDAEKCPYCGTPFRDLEGIEQEQGVATPEEDDAAPETVEVPEAGQTSEDLVVDEVDLKAAPEAAKTVPEGMKKEIRPRPVVQRKAVMPKDEDLASGAISEPEPNGNVVRPRVVRKVAAPALDLDAETEGDGLDEQFSLEEDKEEP